MSNDQDLTRDRALLREQIAAQYPLMLREPGGAFAYPFIVPGSAAYCDCLWDWDSWLTNVALRQAFSEQPDPAAASAAAEPYERGCILNYLAFTSYDGWCPIVVDRGQRVEELRPANIFDANMHKPVLAQHAAFIVRENGGDAEWLRERFQMLMFFVNAYRNHHRHPATGLYYWQTDSMIGVDNDPCTYFRPPKSSGSIYLNCLMYREFLAIAYLCERLGLDEVGAQYAADAARLKEAINEHCWDERDGFYYSVDLNLLPADDVRGLHQGMPRDWPCLIQRIGVWSGFLALWAGVASPGQARRVVEGHLRDARTFNAACGVRTLSKMEKMYNLRASGNPSSWLGPVWGVANYLTWRGLVLYGFEDDARELADKTIRLFGRDMERFGALHEYYQPDSGEPILNRGFQNWNYLVLNMIAWCEGRPVVAEF